MKAFASLQIERLDPWRWRIRRQGAMLTDGLVFAGDALFKDIEREQSLQQVANVACLPGIVGCSLAMPDIHWGYGFPIGAVAAFDLDQGVVSPGGVGYDINCGVRLLTTRLRTSDLPPVRVGELTNGLFRNIPSGVGSSRKDLKLSRQELAKVLRDGAAWAVAAGYGAPFDLDRIEEGGRIPWADPAAVSDQACNRGAAQLGTLGSGNHFVELGFVERIFDREVAAAFGLETNQITVFIHTGSRGLGHQVCDDFLRRLLKGGAARGFTPPDRQLSCAPIRSAEGQAYLAAMGAAANFAFANRQLITHWVRETFQSVLGRPWHELGLQVLYDVCHNMAKIERHLVGQELRSLCVHRKGATRAFAAGRPELPAIYRGVGQPVLIPGDMARSSYVLVGTARAMQETFGSSCHGAGRRLSRHQAIQAARGRSIAAELNAQGIHVQSAGKATLSEEMPEAYKDVAAVVEVVEQAGIGRRVARLRPLGVMKG